MQTHILYATCIYSNISAAFTLKAPLCTYIVYECVYVCGQKKLLFDFVGEMEKVYTLTPSLPTAPSDRGRAEERENV